ncbi:uncharacterized protein LOC111687174 [Lucilia cuprina]|uniref:uncharacterized protein LOC111687174 n=1 Tax=Lucilia cuprina TaxID=7375 RepID=UPI001F06FDFD|nr:uncharacterized protein LOC111687174 [Lucilia cuprina]
MEVKNIQYYLYDDEEGASTAEAVMLEETNLLQHIDEAVQANKDIYSEDELNAATAMMLMHYQAIVHPQTVNTYNFDAQTCQQKEKLQTPKSMMTKEHNNQNIHMDTMEQIRQYRKCNYTQSSLLASCRNILKEFLAQNGL